MRNEAITARLWALKDDKVIIYPVVVPGAPTYSYKTGNRKVVLQKVKVAIKIGNSETIGEKFFKQDTELEEIINQLYIYYYERAHSHE